MPSTCRRGRLSWSRWSTTARTSRNAIALNSSMVNGARLIGPSIAGIVIAGFGEGYCFLIDGISYIAVIASLLLMTLMPTPPPPSAQRRCSPN